MQLHLARAPRHRDLHPRRSHHQQPPQEVNNIVDDY
jgi:hypothetical protein